MRVPLTTIAVISAVVLTACSGGDDASSESTDPKPTTTTVVEAEVALALGEMVAASAGADLVIDEAMQAAVLGAAQQYVDSAVVAPLTGGVVSDTYPALFDAGVQGEATGVDRAALTDEGLPEITASPTITATPVRLDALAGADGAPALLAASFAVTVDAQNHDGPMTISRNVELTLAPSNGSWLVTAYRVGVTRTLPDAAASTTTAAAS